MTRTVRSYSPRVRFVAFSSAGCREFEYLGTAGKRAKTTT